MKDLEKIELLYHKPAVLIEDICRAGREEDKETSL